MESKANLEKCRLLAKKIYQEQIRYKKIIGLVDQDYDFPYESLNPDKQAEHVNLASWIICGKWKEGIDEQRTSNGGSVPSKV